MSVVYILAADGNHTPHEESEIRSLLEQGKLNPEALFWKEGMVDWRPLKELPPPGPVDLSVPVIVPTKSEGFAFTKDPSRLTTVVKVMLVISLGTSLLSLLEDVVNLLFLSPVTGDDDNMTLRDVIQGLLALLYLVVYIATAIPFLKWIYRAKLNCQGFGAKYLQFSPGWSIGSFFVPFLNLVRPYQAMQETWQASTNPREWPSQPFSSLIGWWWGLWLLSNFLGQIYARMAWAGNAGADWVGFGSDTVDIVLCVIAYRMIDVIYQKQKQLVANGLPQETQF